MKIGNKVYVEVVIDKKIEEHSGIYYIAHVDQFKMLGGYDSSISIRLIEGKNKIKEIIND